MSNFKNQKMRSDEESLGFQGSNPFDTEKQTVVRVKRNPLSSSEIIPERVPKSRKVIIDRSNEIIKDKKPIIIEPEVKRKL